MYCQHVVSSHALWCRHPQRSPHPSIHPMTSTQFYGAASLDGFIATPDHDLGWLLQFGEIEGSSYPAFIREVGALAMGSHTYEWMLEHAIDAGQTWPYAQPTWVFSSRTLRGIAGADVRFVRGDVRPVHRAMVQAAAGRNVWIVGGGELAGQFYDAGLLDELIVQIAPVTLGAGTPLLPRRIAQPALRLTSVTTLGGLFAELRYAVPRPESD